MVDGDAVGVGARDGGQQGGRLGPVPALQGSRYGGVRAGQAGAGERGEGGVGAEFQAGGDALFLAGSGRRRRSGPPSRTCRTQYVAGSQGSSAVPGLPVRLDTTGTAAGRAVTPAAHPPRSPRACRPSGRSGRRGDTRSRRVRRPRAASSAATASTASSSPETTVARGPLTAATATAVAVRGEQRGDLVLGRLDGDHGAALGQGLHEPAAGGDQTAGVRERPHARDVRGGQLAHGVAQEALRGDAPGFEQPEQGDLEGEQGRLGEAGARAGPPRRRRAGRSSFRDGRVRASRWAQTAS
ncbi:hypothetical protein STENM223S_04749 [Streptomyces tendae]